MFLFNEEFWNFEEEMEEKVWRDACESEINFIVKNKMWSLVDLFEGVKSIGFKLIFKINII